MKYFIIGYILFIVLQKNASSQNTIPALTYDTAAFRYKIEVAAQDYLVHKSPGYLTISSWGKSIPNDSMLVVIKTNPYNSQPIFSNPLYTPEYVQGAFCDFEDYINKNRKLRINFGVE
ncbi:MAG: hypothetical protein ACKVPJ_06995 [Chitinophagales bacterium]